MIYSEEFKKAAVQKILTKGNRSTKEVIRDLGIHPSTIYIWRDQFANVQDMKKSSKPQNRTVQEKLKALTEYGALPIEKRGEYLRKNGLHEENLTEWKKQLEEAFIPKKKISQEQKDLATEQKKNKQLEREIRRKDKALAEVSALLILKKKADLIWGSEEDE